LFVYEVKYLFKSTISSNNNSIENDEENTEEDSISEGNMYLGCDCIQDAFIEGAEILDNMLDGENYEIIAVNGLPINIMNWPGEGEPCQCPFCRAERMADEDRMHFECPKCKEKIEVADGGWEEIQCPKCQNEISRDKVIDIGNGKQKVLEI
jgi:Zn finger protein HypA/HybF involved in hydrogenase expression